MSTLTDKLEMIEEVIDGVVHEMPPASPDHASLIDRLIEILQLQLDRKRFLVRTTQFAFGIRRGEGNYRVPDVSVFKRAELAAAPRERNLLFARPLLIAEVLSPANRKGDVEKLVRDYSTAEVPELWLIRPEERLVDIAIFHSGAGLTIDQHIHSGRIVATNLPGVSVEVEELWAAFGG